jgi:hypothetical protein
MVKDVDTSESVVSASGGVILQKSLNWRDHLEYSFWSR